MDEDSDTTTPSESAPLSVWIGLTIIAAISFWCQATVTEERFVPALNVIATVFHIPSDVAGATLMAAGASSPELFSSFVALFITHSALGLGTIVGSEIFNQLIICCGAVFASKSGKLELDPAILTREVGFYALSIVLLYAALQDSRPDPEQQTGVNYIYVNFGDAVMVFVGYIAYVWVCGNMQAVVDFCTRIYRRTARRAKQLIQKARNPQGGGPENLYLLSSRGQQAQAGYGGGGGPIGTPSDFSRRISMTSGTEHDIPFLQERDITAEPESNFSTVVEYERTVSGERSLHDDDARSSITRSLQSAAQAIGGKFSDGQQMRAFEFLQSSRRPSQQRGIRDIEYRDVSGKGGFECFLWQRSYFYTQARFATNAWHLRWFTFSGNDIYSVPDRNNAKRHRIKYPKIRAIEVDEKRMIVKMLNAVEGKRHFTLMAPSMEILESVVIHLEELLHPRGEGDVLEAAVTGVGAAKGGDDEDDAGGAEIDDEGFESGDEFESMVEYPSHGSNMDVIFFLLLYPFRFLIHWTIPDVRVLDKEGNPVTTGGLDMQGKAFLAIFMCLLWLIVGSYAMVASLEALADLMGIPDVVVGVTVSAAGTSLPNYVASKVAANKGFGNMAVSNAFGSNTFNIMIGLGLPWVLYTSFGTGFKPYHGLKDENIMESVLILAIVLAVFIVIVLFSNFTLYKWHGVLFAILYVGYLAFVIGQVYLF